MAKGYKQNPRVTEMWSQTQSVAHSLGTLENIT